MLPCSLWPKGYTAHVEHIHTICVTCPLITEQPSWLLDEPGSSSSRAVWSQLWDVGHATPLAWALCGQGISHHHKRAENSEMALFYHELWLTPPVLDCHTKPQRTHIQIREDSACGFAAPCCSGWGPQKEPPWKWCPTWKRESAVLSSTPLDWLPGGPYGWY